MNLISGMNDIPTENTNRTAKQTDALPSPKFHYERKRLSRSVQLSKHVLHPEAAVRYHFTSYITRVQL